MNTILNTCDDFKTLKEKDEIEITFKRKSNPEIEVISGKVHGFNQENNGINITTEDQDIFVKYDQIEQVEVLQP